MKRRRRSIVELVELFVLGFAYVLRAVPDEDVARGAGAASPAGVFQVHVVMDKNVEDRAF